MFTRFSLLLFIVSTSAFGQLTISPAPAGPFVVGEGFGLGNGQAGIASANGGQAPYSWTLVSGVIPAGLTLTASTFGEPALTGTLTTPGTFVFTLNAQDSSAPIQTATQTFSITVTIAPLSITPANLPGGVVGGRYASSGEYAVGVPSAAGGLPPYSWSILSGTLPPGLTLHPTTPFTDPVAGAIPGAFYGSTLTAAGTYSFTLQVVDSSPTPLIATQVFSLSVANVIEYPDPAFGGPQGIVKGPDGALWFTESNSVDTDAQGNSLYGIGRITTAGAITNSPFPLPQVPSGGVNLSPQAVWITAGQDGSLWFIEPTQQYIGQMTKSGVVAVQYDLPVITVAGVPTYLYPNGITSGPDGAIWFTVYGQFGAPYGGIGRIATTADHTVTYFQVSTNPASNPQGITSGPDGYLWFTDSGLDQNGNTREYIGRMSTSGQLAPPVGCASPTLECVIPGTQASTYNAITQGPDGALWFTDQLSNQIGRLTPDGNVLNLYSVPTAGANPLDIATGSDGALWFAESGSNASSAGRITVSGVITEFPTSASTSGITLGPDGALWFTEQFGNNVGRIVPPLALACSLPGSEQVGATLTSAVGCPAFGGTGPYKYSITSGTLPPGLSLDAATGIISGSPSAPGTYAFTIQATDNGTPAETAAQELTITAAPRQPLLFTCIFPSGAQAGVPYSSTCVTSGGIAPYAYTVSVGALPAGLTLTPSATGLVISGTPTNYGTFSFTLQATDSGTPVYTATQSVTALPVLPPPLVLTCAISAKAQVGIAYLKTCTATGGIPPYTYSIGTGALPSGLSIDPAAGAISGVPTTAGPSTFNIQVHDTGPPVQTAIVAASLTVIPPRLGMMCNFTRRGTVGTKYATACVVANGTPPYKFSVQAGTLPTGLSLNPFNGKFTGLTSAAGTFPFTVVVSDSESPAQAATQMVSFSVVPVSLEILTKTVPDGAMQLPYSANPVVEGGVAPYQWIVASGALPPGITLNAGTGALTGTPTASGPYSFQIQVTDSSAKPQTAAQTFSQTVSGPVTPDYTEYPTPGATGIGGLVTGPDGALWFSTPNQAGGNLIGRMTTAGVVTTIPAPNPLSNVSEPGGIAVGPDGGIWFTERSSDRIGQLTTDGTLSLDFPAATSAAGPQQITSGPDGALWFTESGVSQIGQISAGGIMLNEFPTLTAGSLPDGIAVGPDNSLWFTESATDKIGHLTTDGKTQYEYEIPTAGANPTSIVAGPDGALWFTETAAGKIGRISTTGRVTEYATPTPASGPSGIAAGADGTLYFTENSVNQLGRITTDGVITEYPVPTAASGPQGLTLGPDGAIWLAESTGNKLARFSLVNQLSLTCTFPVTGSVAVSTSYSAACTASLGTAPYTYAISSGTLPPGVNLDPATGIISGTLSTPGTYSFTVRATDSGLPAQTATQKSAALTVSPGSLVLACTVPGSGQVGSAYQGTCSGSGGTAPYIYTISSGTLPPGVTLDAPSGTVSGTPTAPGTFPFTIQISDFGTPAQVATQVFTATIQLGTTTGGGGALFSFVALPANQPQGLLISNFVVQLNQVSPTPVSGTLALGFTPYTGDAAPAGYIDPALQFMDASGNKMGTTYKFTIPAGSSKAAIPNIDPGSVAGSISVSLTANGVAQTSSDVFVVAGAPTIDPGSVQMTNFTADGFDVEFVATSTTREGVLATFAFTPASGSALSGVNTFTVDVSAALANWFSSPGGLSYGGDFTLTVPFKLSGPASAIGSVSVTLSNGIGTSAAVSGTR